MSDEHDFGRHVRRLRRARGLTQAELSERAGLAEDTIRRLERGTFSPSLRTLRRVAVGLDLPLMTVFESLEFGEHVDLDLQVLLGLLRTHQGLPTRAIAAFVQALVESRRVRMAAYLTMERAAEVKHELWRGEVLDVPSASFEHNQIVANLMSALVELSMGRPCVALGPAMKVHVPRFGGCVYPDALVVCGEPTCFDDVRDVVSNPRMIVEVMSPASERFDRGEKLAGYRSLPSVVDCVLVEQGRVAVEHHERQEGSVWVRREFGVGATLELAGVGGSLGVDEIYRKVAMPRSR